MKQINKIRLITLLLALSLILSSSTFVTKIYAVETYDFNDFSEEDSIDFVIKCGIEIPSKLMKSDYLPLVTQQIIIQSYYYPDVAFCFNYPETQEYAEKIRNAVKLYTSSTYSRSSSNLYHLQYNKVMDEDGIWVTSGGYYNSRWENYNCYAYSIRRGEYPNFYSSSRQYQPGDMSESGDFYSCSSIEELALVIANDLTAMGYSNVCLSSVVPTIDSSQELICVRMWYDIDYHFMRYDLETDAWYHKPGNTAILKYNYVPSNDLVWYGEYSYEGREYESYYNYNSDIMYISYSKNRIDFENEITYREYIHPHKDVFCELVLDNDCTYEVKIESDYSIEYEIYDKEFNIISSGNGNTSLLTINLDIGKYYLRMNFESYDELYYVDIEIDHTNPHNHSYEPFSRYQHKAYCRCGDYILEDHVADPNSPIIEECMLCKAPHEHTYNDHYTYIDSTSHTAYCVCGTSHIEGHVIAGSGSASPLAPKPFKICLLCGGLASGGYDHMGIATLPHTENGSYISSNGVIVLADEDIEAFMNGELEFIYPDDGSEFS